MTQASLETYADSDNKKDRATHREIILNAITQHGPINLDHLVSRTYLTKHILSRRISELMDDGKVFIAGVIQENRRRPQSLFMTCNTEQEDFARKQRRAFAYKSALKRLAKFQDLLPEEILVKLNEILKN